MLRRKRGNLEFELPGRREKPGIEVVRNRPTVRQANMTVVIGQVSRVPFPRYIEAGLKLQLLEVRCNLAFQVVVVNLSPIEPKVPDAEIKNVGLAGFLLGLVTAWEICFSLAIREHVHDRMLDSSVLDIPRSSQQRGDSYLQVCLVRL